VPRTNTVQCAFEEPLVLEVDDPLDKFAPWRQHLALWTQRHLTVAVIPEPRVTIRGQRSDEVYAAGPIARTEARWLTLSLAVDLRQMTTAACLRKWGSPMLWEHMFRVMHTEHTS